MLGGIKFKNAAVSGVVGIVISLIFLFLSSVVMLFDGVPESVVELFVIISTLAGMFMGGIISSKKSGCRGWLNGGMAGLVYVILLAVMSMLVSGFPGAVKLLITLTVGFLTGAAGGIVGINFKSKSSRRKHR